MKKSEIRKKILKIIKNNKIKYSKIDFKNILKILNKIDIKTKIVGGYYPFNYEVDVIEILEKFEKEYIIRFLSTMLNFYLLVIKRR